MSEKKTYTISFKADLTEADLRALSKYFYKAMNEALEIYAVYDLTVVQN
jgi:hypothetical protein